MISVSKKMAKIGHDGQKKTGNVGTIAKTKFCKKQKWEKVLETHKTHKTLKHAERTQQGGTSGSD